MPHPLVTRDPDDPAFPHGETRGYGRGCRCDPCKEAKYRYTKRVKRRSPSVPARPVIAHVQGLIGAGAGVSAISRLTGTGPGATSRGGVRLLAEGTSKRVAAARAEAILAITVTAALGDTPTANHAEAVHYARTLQALGWPLRWQAHQIGVCADTGLHFLRTGCKWVEHSTVVQMRALAAEVGDRPGPDRRTARWANRLGWHVPAAYDEQRNLVPGAALAAQSHGSTVGARDERQQVRREQVLRLSRLGRSATDIAAILRITSRTVVRDRTYLAGQGLYEQPASERESAA